MSQRRAAPELTHALRGGTTQSVGLGALRQLPASFMRSTSTEPIVLAPMV
jgi:hypothetical protein